MFSFFNFSFIIWVDISFKIHILSPELSNKIAAGEVVQRPAAVVKELIENSLDAKAARISVIVKDAGKALIQVVDDGEGMSEQDASLAFRNTYYQQDSFASDLEEIRTLGFRSGRLPASIAAVAQVELKLGLIRKILQHTSGLKAARPYRNLNQHWSAAQILRCVICFTIHLHDAIFLRQGIPSLKREQM